MWFSKLNILNSFLQRDDNKEIWNKDLLEQIKTGISKQSMKKWIINKKLGIDINFPFLDRIFRMILVAENCLEGI